MVQYILQRTDKNGRKLYRTSHGSTKQKIWAKLDENHIRVENSKKAFSHALKVWRKEKDGRKYKVIPIVKIIAYWDMELFKSEKSALKYYNECLEKLKTFFL